MSVAAFLCGLALALAFPRSDLAPLAWVAPVPWMALLIRSSPGRGLRAGFAFGAGFFGLLLNWVHGVLSHYTSLPLVLTLPIWTLLIGYLSLYTALFGLALSSLGRRFGAGALIAAPFLWTGLEFLRGRALGGFPWGEAGCARSGGLALLQAASVGGVGLVSFLLVTVWAALTALLVKPGSRGARGADGDPTSVGIQSTAVGSARPEDADGRMKKSQRGRRHSQREAGSRARQLLAVAALGAVLGSAGLGALRLALHPPPPREELFGGSGPVNSGIEPGSLGLGLVQGGYGSDLDWEQAKRALLDYLDLSRLAARSSPDLIVWPESNVPLELESSPAWRDTLMALSRETGARLLLGGISGTEAAGLRNSAFLIGPEGIEFRYDKRRLVQYGEYVPLKRFFPFIRHFVPEAGDFVPGEKVGVAPFDGRRLGVAICYEMIFPDEILSQARDGADLLVNITNDSWFVRGGPWQLSDFCRLRAVETGLWTVRVASTGRTMVLDPLGREMAAGGIGGAAVLVARIPPPDGSARTPFVRWGEWVGKGCATITALALAFLGVGNIIDTKRRAKDNGPIGIGIQS